MLVKVLRDRWSAVENKTPVTEAELDEAETLADTLANAVNLRERSSVEVATATDERARAFTVFVRAYDDARRAAIFLRWREDDADEWVPSLYAGHGGRGKKTSSAPPATASEPAASPSPAPAPVVPTNGASVPHGMPNTPQAVLSLRDPPNGLPPVNGS